MNAPAVYNLDLVARVRDLARRMTDGSIAQEIGWDVDGLRRMARKHGIKLTEGPPTAASSVTSSRSLDFDRRDGLAPAKSRPPVIRRLAEEPRATAKPIAGLLWDAEIGVVAYGKLMVTLPPGLKPIFGQLVFAHRENPDGYLSSAAFDVDRRDVSRLMNDLADILAPLDIDIDTKKSVNGGYRLVDLASGEGLSP